MSPGDLPLCHSPDILFLLFSPIIFYYEYFKGFFKYLFDFILNQINQSKYLVILHL